VTASDRILDVGCGTGVLTGLIGKELDRCSGGEIVGIDAAPKMIKVAERKRSSPTTRFVTAAAERLPFPDATFDKACSAFFFHHVDFELKVEALLEIRRVMRDGCEVILLDADTPTNWFGLLSMRLGEWLFRQPEIGENRKGRLREAFTSAGLHGWKAIAHWQGYITLFSMRT